MESTAETSVLSTYSISGLLKESQEDIVSSMETDIPSDLPGDNTSKLLETGTAAATAAATNGTSSFLVVTALGKTTAVGLTTLPEIAELALVQLLAGAAGGGSFFVFATLVPYQFKIHNTRERKKKQL